MKVKVKVVGPLQQYVKKPKSQWDLQEGTVVNKLLNLLGFPEKIRKMPIMILVNMKFCKSDVKLKDGDEVILLWPVGGG
ncbi:MAG: MoaD/ThiS family protein [Actinobacteria bacterium]|nr:MoaD/ThiS family protein [Actinomycetota bacterium]